MAIDYYQSEPLISNFDHILESPFQFILEVDESESSYKYNLMVRTTYKITMFDPLSIRLDYTLPTGGNSSIYYKRVHINFQPMPDNEWLFRIDYYEQEDSTVYNSLLESSSAIDIYSIELTVSSIMLNGQVKFGLNSYQLIGYDFTGQVASDDGTIIIGGYISPDPLSTIYNRYQVTANLLVAPGNVEFTGYYQDHHYGFGVFAGEYIEWDDNWNGYNTYPIILNPIFQEALIYLEFHGINEMQTMNYSAYERLFYNQNMPIFSRTGYQFISYISAYDNYIIEDGDIVYEIADNGGHVYHAQWEINTYTVTFDTNGGTSIPSRQVEYNNPVGIISYTTKTGYTFGGWYDNSSFNGTAITSNTLITNNITFYAKWNISIYTVTFNSNGGSSILSKQVEHGNTIGSLSVPTKTGYTFGGWYDNSSLSGSSVTSNTVITNNITLYAKWNTNSNCYVKHNGIYVKAEAYTKYYGRYKKGDLYVKHNNIYKSNT